MSDAVLEGINQARSDGALLKIMEGLGISASILEYVQLEAIFHDVWKFFCESECDLFRVGLFKEITNIELVSWNFPGNGSVQYVLHYLDEGIFYQIETNPLKITVVRPINVDFSNFVEVK